MRSYSKWIKTQAMVCKDVTFCLSYILCFSSFLLENYMLAKIYVANAFGQYLLILTIDLNTVWLLLAMCDLYISSWPASITRQKKQIINIKLSPTMQWEVSQFLNTDPSYNFLETETKITNPSPKSESRGNTWYDNVHSIYSCDSN